LIGVVVGAIAGFNGGWADAFLMRFTDGMLAVPAFFFILVVITVLGSGIATLILVIGALSWMPVARVVYGETLRWKTAEFVVAAISLGVPAPRLLVRHILPQAIPSLVVSATLGVAAAILTESALSYLGLGVQAPFHRGATCCSARRSTSSRRPCSPCTRASRSRSSYSRSTSSATACVTRWIPAAVASIGGLTQGRTR